ncbi:MAG: ParA family protein [Magnetospirillum sp. WYHS-4]
MSAKVLTIAQQKGGAGKTTLAAQLAVAWSARGLKVAALDIDPQGSLLKWHEVRMLAGTRPDGLTVGKVGGWRVPSEVDRLRREADLVIVDSPPHADTEAKIAVRSADLVLVPVQPSSMDVWATGQTLTLAVAERVPALVVLNRVPARAKLVEAARAMLMEQDMPVMECFIGNRVAFAASMMDGRAVVETEPRGQAAQELEALMGELAARLGL